MRINSETRCVSATLPSSAGQDQIKKRDAQRVLAAEANLLKRLEDAMQVLTKQIDWGDNEKAVRIYEKGVQDVRSISVR